MKRYDSWHESREVKLTEIFATWRQLMMLESGQHLLQLQEEPFARCVAVGVHVEVGRAFSVEC